MKLVTSFAIAALIAAPTIALAQSHMSGPGQSEFAPGQRATTSGGAKTFAPGQRMHTKDVKSQPGASEYAPGHLPNKDVKR